MDVEKLIRKGKIFSNKRESIEDELIQDLTDALSALQAENEKLRAELEQVKAELNAAIKDLRGKCSACANYTLYHNDGPCATCKFEIACFVPEKATDKWQWRGPQKED